MPTPRGTSASAAHPCALCDQRCASADLGPLLSADLAWLWRQIAAAADRRGDADLADGTLKITAPASAAERAAASGLLGGQPLRPGQQRTIVLEQLSSRVRVRGSHLTPGAVAAHATDRPLAVKAKARARRDATEHGLQAQLDQAERDLPEHVRTRLGPDVWGRLRRSGALTRLLKEPDPVALLTTATAVLAALPTPGQRIDRRVLVPGSPHALDDGASLAGLVFALCDVTGRRPRHAWDAVGVDIDNLTGGLQSLGIHPAGWHLPPTAVVTLPPRELADVLWPAPATPGSWVFVTENPSVLAAAADAVARTRIVIRLLCTVGTPSAVEVDAVGRLTSAGWNVAVRADFDPSGLGHVRALLRAAPTAAPWRMSAGDYEASLDPSGQGAGLTVETAAAPWDAELAATMTRHGQAAYEEALLPLLLDDLTAGQPPAARHT